MDSFFVVFEYVRFVLLVAVMGYAAFQDHRSGRVPNRIWKYAFVALPLTFVEYAVFASSLLWLAGLSLLLSVAISVAIFYVAAYFKQPWGGADTKAIMVIACGLPLTPVLWAGSLLSFTPLLALFFGCVFAFWSAVLRRKRRLRFLPYLFVGFVLACVF